MKILTVTNLYPRPDEPRRGLYNARLFHALACEKPESLTETQRTQSSKESTTSILNLVLVPEWRMWRWPAIRRWKEPLGEGSVERGKWEVEGEERDRRKQEEDHGPRTTDQGPGMDVVAGACQAVVSENIRLRQRLVSPAGGSPMGTSGTTSWNEKHETRHAKLSLPSHSTFLVPLSTCYVPVFYVPLLGRNWSYLMYAWSLKKYRKTAEEADSILATWLYPDAVAAARALWDGKKPFIIKAHGSDRFHLHAKRGRHIVRLARRAAAVIVNSEFLADRLTARGIPRERTHVIRHGVDVECFKPRSRTDALRALNMQRLYSRSIILWVGNLKDDKQPALILRAFAGLRSGQNEGGDAPFLAVIGDGPLRSRLEKMCSDLGRDQSVLFTGSIEPERVAWWMNVAHCLCLTSSTESMPNVVLESLASGTPVVATDVGDVSVFVKDGENGFVVESDTGSLAKALGKCLNTQYETEKVAEGVRHLSWQNTAREILKLIAEHLSQSHGEHREEGNKGRKEGNEKCENL